MHLEHLDGAGTRDRLGEIETVYAEAFPRSDLGDWRARTGRQITFSGFEAVTARLDGALAGFVYGLPLSARSSWWEGLEPVPPPDFITETGARTFAVIDLAVRPVHRGQGMGRRLLDELLAGRAEERATLATAPDDRDVQRMYRRWGWRHVGRTPGQPGEAEAAFEIYVIDLPRDAASSSR
ncbi:GNAT family N-acetyltransferase [Actinomadura sp. 9N407]|uniref:GNAT family N-acetyltransferase n=1 Tax=Actinomadura sp. 9N407 TaxID=3375154 RepID=UPI0037AF5E65